MRPTRIEILKQLSYNNGLIVKARCLGPKAAFAHAD
jgi:hypothetical protein